MSDTTEKHSHHLEQQHQLQRQHRQSHQSHPSSRQQRQTVASAQPLPSSPQHSHHSRESHMSTTKSPEAAASREEQPAQSFVAGARLDELPTDAVASLRRARADGYDFVVTELPYPPSCDPYGDSDDDSEGEDGCGDDEDDSGGEEDGGDEDCRGTRRRRRATSTAAPPRSDLTGLESKWWSTSVVGVAVDPPFLRKGNSNGGDAASVPFSGSRLVNALTDSSYPARQRRAERCLASAMEWAGHMNVPAVILPPVPMSEGGGGGAGEMDGSDNGDGPGHGKVAGGGATAAAMDNPAAKEYARVLSSLVLSASHSQVQIWIRVPFESRAADAYALLLQRLDHPSNVGCLLVATDPSRPPDAAAGMARAASTLHGLVGRNVKAVSFDCAVFLTNKRGYPTLAKGHQWLFAELLRRLGRTVRVVVEGRVRAVDVASALAGGKIKSGSYASASAVVASLSGSGGSSSDRLLTGIDGGGETKRLSHLQYLRHLRARPGVSLALDGEEGKAETPYLDHLQSPLQPLGDHLEYQTYETFERDPVKYERYGTAIALALEDGLLEGRFTRVGTLTPEPAADGGGGKGNGVEAAASVDVFRATILVVGAGRGPLVREAIAAVARVSRALSSENGPRNGSALPRGRALCASVVAIEKNPSAAMYLRSLKAREAPWSAAPLGGGGDGTARPFLPPGGCEVTIVECDMRRASAQLRRHPDLRTMMERESDRADVVVSELLGSFGDNELSPECLDGVQACGILKANCASIPASYTSFLAPVSSARLHAEARSQSCLPLSAADGPGGPASGSQRAFETPYVVRSHAASQTHVERACWTFTHPHPAAAAVRSAGGRRGVDGGGDDGDDRMDTDQDDRRPELASATAAASEQRKTDDDYDRNHRNSNRRRRNPSSMAALRADNDRAAHLSFPYDATLGAGSGCGYGPYDPDVAAVASASANTNASAAASPSECDPALVAPADGALDVEVDPPRPTVVIHGFLGSFHSVLYESSPAQVAEIERRRRGNGGQAHHNRGRRSSVISIAPSSFSVGMFSWFPLYFPLKEPLRVPPGATVHCSIWRRSDLSHGGGGGGRIWYEWIAEVTDVDSGAVLGASSVHNPGGRSYHVRL